MNIFLRFYSSRINSKADLCCSWEIRSHLIINVFDWFFMNITKGKTYYVRVRGYKVDAYGNYYYTPYSKVKKITVKK